MTVKIEMNLVRPSLSKSCFQLQTFEDNFCVKTSHIVGEQSVRQTKSFPSSSDWQSDKNSTANIFLSFGPHIMIKCFLFHFFDHCAHKTRNYETQMRTERHL